MTTSLLASKPVVRFHILHKPDDVLVFLTQVCAEADKEKDALGFLPEYAYRDAAEQGKLLVACAQESAQTIYVGHLLFGGVFPYCRIFQAHVSSPFRRYGVGRMLVDQLVRIVEAASFLSITAKVADDLEANKFWERMRFQSVRTKPGGLSRNRSINVRVRELDTPRLFSLFPERAFADSDLRLVERMSTKAAVYVLDLNVFFDIAKERNDNEEAGRLLAAAFSNLIRLAVTSEFITELQRNSKAPDPILKFALQLPVLQSPARDHIERITKDLAILIFPQQASQGQLSVQDHSDLVHLSVAILQGASGFVTREKAILRSRFQLHQGYGIDVISSAELAASLDTTAADDLLPTHAHVGESSLLVLQPSSQQAFELKTFLERQHVPKSLQDDTTNNEPDASHRQLIVRVPDRIIGFSSWETSCGSPLKMEAFVCIDEDHQAVEAVLDHLLSTICRESSRSQPAFVSLRILPGHAKTRSSALTHGFRAAADGPSTSTTLHKVCLGHSATPDNWSSVRQQLSKIARMELPATIPEFRDFKQLITVKAPTGESVSIPLSEIEVLLSPALLLLPGRDGAIIPIRARFAAELLGTSSQMSFLASPTAALLRERAYFSDPRNRHVLKPGTPILFYESGKDGGRSSVIAAARTLDTELVAKKGLETALREKGVLSSNALERLTRSRDLAATRFDNILIFQKPVSLSRLRILGFDDRSNIVTARRMSASLLEKVLQDGEPTCLNLMQTS